MSTRVDVLLVERGHAPTRSAAQRLIEQGVVMWRVGIGPWQVVRKAGETPPAHCELSLINTDELRWASRGGLKLDGALQALGLNPQGVALDVGQSTGGFTDVLLARGAERVVGLDVGRDQLVPRLRGDARVVCLEGCNARHLSAEDLGEHRPPQGFDWIVGDLSFISQTLVWPALQPLLAEQGQMLMLVKPQFELQPQDIGKGGLVKQPSAYTQVEQRLREAAHGLGLQVRAWIDSPIAGGDGNREFFIHLSRTP